jgi:hypothetical protein
MIGARMVALALALALAPGCAKDSSAEMDRAADDLRAAETVVGDKRGGLTAGSDDIEHRKREIGQAQRDLADKEKVLASERLQLESARQTLANARVAYDAAVRVRLAKLDAELATLATRTDAASRDAATGLTARRQLLATRLTEMPTEADARWKAYTADVDTTFDAIERDLRRATK